MGSGCVTADLVGRGKAIAERLNELARVQCLSEAAVPGSRNRDAEPGTDNENFGSSGEPAEVDVPPTPAEPEFTLTRLADVQPVRVSWLWRGWLPVGKLVTLDGDPGLGKSTLSDEFSAVVSTGGTWPDGTVCDHPGAVLLMSAEDGLADTVRPRLDAAGADVTKVFAIEGVPVDGEGTLRPPTLGDVQLLDRAIVANSARLLVIDVVMAYLPTGTDAHKDQDIRRVLNRLSSLADRTGCTILLLRHLNKAKGGDPLYRGGGSIGIVGAARAGLIVAPDPDDSDVRVLASVKSNLGPAPEAMSYRLVGSGEHGVARVQWEGVTTHTARELLAEPSSDSDRDDVDRWLAAFLKGGRQTSNDVYAAAEGAGYSRDKAKRAKSRLGIDAVRDGQQGAWYWSLPQGSTQPSTTPVTAPLLPCRSGHQETPENRQGSKGAQSPEPASLKESA